MGQKAAIQRQIDLLRVGPPPTPPQLSPTAQGRAVDIQQQKGERKQLKRQFKTSRRASNVAARMIQRGLHSAVGELQANGLQGPELQAAVREFAARQADAVSAARFTTNANQKDFQKADQTLAENITQAKVEQKATVQQDRQQYAQDLGDYERKVQVAGLQAAARAAGPKSGASGGLTPTQQRAQAQSRQAALIQLKGLLSSTAPTSSDNPTPIRETLRALLRQGRPVFLQRVVHSITGSHPTDIAWALDHLTQQVQAATQGNAKALHKVQQGGYGGRTSQVILGRG